MTVLGTGVRRYSREIETAAYFCCLEAMQNAAKHARTATVVVIELADEDGTLRLEARDDGDGFDERTITRGRRPREHARTHRRGGRRRLDPLPAWSRHARVRSDPAHHPTGVMHAPAPVASVAGAVIESEGDHMGDLVEYPPGDEFPGMIGRTVEESSPAWPAPVRARDGAPNVLFFVLDDVGYGQLCCFGGLVETPNIDRVAAHGLRYANMHTTALCSPTRSCILTGRNHHSSGVACIMELATGYPGYDGRMPFENGMLPEMLLPSTATTRSASASGTCRRRRTTRPPARSTAGRSAAASSASTASSAARPTSGIRT